MAKRFNVTGLCVPEKHYMVDLTQRVKKIREMVDDGFYFIINRARQYGKTTTLSALARELERDYLVISLDFQMLGSASFREENTFSLSFLRILLRELKRHGEAERAGTGQVLEQMQEVLEKNDRMFLLLALFELLLGLCESSARPVVLMIDEVDSASDNQVFLDFLAQLRNYYLEREAKGTAVFHSVVLAGVYDVKNLKRKVRPEEEHRMNSPWNIAADFKISMSFSEEEIAGMLREYEADHHTGMDMDQMSGLLYDYTSGYPYLVSRLCRMMDEEIDRDSPWTREGFLEAVRLLLQESNTLFESLVSKITAYPELEQMLRELLFSGKAVTYSPTNLAVGLAVMFGFVKNDKGKAVPANRIFDTLLYDHFLSLDELRASRMYKVSLQDKDTFIKQGRLDMVRVLEKFVQHFHELYGDCKETFLEEEGRRYFLLYLRPIINGTGNYYVEARTRSLGRTDIVVDYCGEQFVIETKIWRGNEYNLRGERQLAEYLEDYGLDRGYMLSFNFNRKKQIGVHEICVWGKSLIEAVV